MRLAEFICATRERILSESVVYATEIPVLKSRPDSVLRNHLPLILDAIAADLEELQSRRQSVQKSQGKAPPPAAETAAQVHGAQRAHLGLDIKELVAEYRVLRSCVLRLWSDSHVPDRHTLEDTMRFNEAIDQAVAESVSFHSAELQKWRDITLAVLGHDLRGPISAMLLTAELMARGSPENALALSTSMLRSGRRLASLLDSLLEYNKASLGMGMALQRERLDLKNPCQDEVEMLRQAFPQATINYAASGDTQGAFDASRVREALANLISNAAAHGLPGTSIDVSLEGGPSNVEISVENAAKAISPDVLPTLFEPMKRHTHEHCESAPHLGLGLFIVREITRAHGGEVRVVPTAERIRFKMVLPKAMQEQA